LRPFPLVLLFILFFAGGVHCQVITPKSINGIEYKRVKVRKKFAKSPDVLAEKITADLTDDQVKVYAMSEWICRKIKYDFRGFIQRRVHGRDSKNVLKHRRALCGEYAQLLNEMCSAIGINSETVEGYTLDFDHFPGDTLYRAEHAWNLINIDSKWQLTDLTFASGYMAKRKQYFRRLLWQFFQIPFEQKHKFVQKFNSDFFDVSPRKMIETHFPVMAMNQLLSPSVTLNQFTHSRIPTANFVELDGSAELNKYHSSDQFAKWRTYGIEGKKSNPENNRVFGVSAYLIADSLFKRYYIPEDKILGCTDRVIWEMDSLIALADSFLLLSKRDNRLELNAKNTRSQEWKTSLKEKNSEHLTHIAHRKRKNRKQVYQIKKIHRKLKLTKKYAKKAARRTKAVKIDKVSRPKKMEKDNPSLIDSLFIQNDIVKHRERTLLAIRDSIMTDRPVTLQTSVTEIEEENKTGHRENSHMLKSYIKHAMNHSIKPIFKCQIL